MIYPGNTSLSTEIQERILGTFEQTLELAEKGSREEAVLGCDFILRLDPDFRPAHRLNQRLESGVGPVGVDDLRLGNDDGLVDSLFEPLPEDDLDSLDLSMTEISDAGGGLESPPVEEDLGSQLRSLVDERRFEEALRLAGTEKAKVGADPELVALVETARSRHEARLYVDSFAKSAKEALSSGKGGEAEKLIAKIKVLDPSYPGLDDLATLAGGASAHRSHFDDPYPSAQEPSPTPPAAAPDEPSSDLDVDDDLFLDLDDSEPVDADLLFDTPASEAPAPGADSIDVPTAPPSSGTPGDSSLGGESELLGGDAESDRRIRALLEEGQAAFDQADYQAAIDIWSRIFLIDIDHESAAERIEKARRQKAEQERQVEEIFHDAVSRFEAGNREEAKDLFEKVLSLNPSHLVARDYLQQIEKGGEAPVSTRVDSETGESGQAGDGASDRADLSEEILVPPDPGGMIHQPPEVVPATSGSGLSMVANKKASGGSRKFLVIGGVVLAAVLVAGGYLFQNRARFFPNSDEELATEERATDPIERATKLHEDGKTAIAISQLRRLPPFDPHYEAAQALVSQWEAGTAPEIEEVEEGPEPLTAQQVAQRATLTDEAEQAFNLGANLRTTSILMEAAALAPLTSDEARMARLADEALEPLKRQIEMIRGGDWEFVLPELWRMHDSDPANPDVTQLLVNVYYNLGVRHLQRGDPSSASDQFEEALDLHPDDPEIQRHTLLADTYKDRRKDLLYRIYVKYLSFRAT